MAKKISKNSRAARNGDALEPEARSLQQLPRADKTDLTNILIRTTAKNEALLEAKLNKKTKNKVSKNKITKQKINANTEKLTKALNITGRLDGKIAKSISRAKYIQSTRKAGWDSTNDNIKKELAGLQKEELIKPKDNDEVSEEDHMSDGEDLVEQPTKELSADSSKNLFSMLNDDVEA